ncbi:glycosyltransferase family 9 protein [Cedecea neteri]|uniref:Glycosyl transferase n=1 Tax=Cedecea neteri TaxID=158822 RepID=A0A291E4V0_9ENTR|nr:glycosyltransferase family 9 protein [Cedecea neteri]ATF94878.1 glycosyl transferase [Cedecea neteri]
MKVLIIRRDNIGDLILTTPLISTLAKELNCKVGLLVNTYNKSILEHNPNVGKVFLYSKLHHRTEGTSKINVLFQRLKTIISLRREKYDVAIVAKERWDKRPLLWAKLSGAKRVIAIGNNCPDSITDAIPETEEKLHLVNLLARLGTPLGCTSAPGPLELYVTEEEVNAIKSKINFPEDNLPVYGLQISSRRIEQQWPKELFVEFARRLAERESCHILLFWSPGKSDNQQHPGDDEKAEFILEQCADLPIIAVKTKNVRELMAGMALCDQIVTSDGGALHIAAGVQKPIVALFGNRAEWLWTPWGVPFEMLQGRDYDVRNISVDDVMNRFVALRERVKD